ncbi:MAG: Phospho-N-acetylmuramoyl-pentapeptide-transferase [Parcubacteria group bacterium GW2011_GWA2_51_10]|nr:MAG: Phospho-N-acetylmuramoyl-pentapeptide-transferase [Parcubacteria group bacterium GW2011_GWA2_51_10]
MQYDIVRILVPAGAAFVIGMILTPILTHYLYKYRAWKKIPGKTALDGTPAAEFNYLHEKHEVRAPRMGGIVVWGSVLLTIIGIALVAEFMPSASILKLDFLSRSQTWIPLAALLTGSFAGLLDDFLVVRHAGGGLSLRARLAIVVLLSLFLGWWFYAKLGVTAVNIPFGNPFEIGWLIIPLFVAIALAVYASGVIDGIDGLSGGVFASVFASYALIAYAQNQIDLSAFSAAIVGGLLAFLWFNIPPARFYMSDTGTMGLTLALAVTAFMTDNLGGGIGISVLPVIGALLVATVASDIAQVLSKRFLGRKVFRIAPLHHHFEAIGWPGYKVVMRYWVLSIIFAFAGVIIAILSLR